MNTDILKISIFNFLSAFAEKYINRSYKESFFAFEYYEVIILVGAWSNLIKRRGLYDRFDQIIYYIIHYITYNMIFHSV